MREYCQLVHILCGAQVGGQLSCKDWVVRFSGTKTTSTRTYRDANSLGGLLRQEAVGQTTDDMTIVRRCQLMPTGAYRCLHVPMPSVKPIITATIGARFHTLSSRYRCLFCCFWPCLHYSLAGLALSKSPKLTNHAAEPRF